MIEKDNLFALVVWYNPTSVHANNVKTYFDEVKVLIIIDNSDIDNSSLFSDLDHSKIIYIANHENIGLASALNLGCKLALNKGAKWVLTMDQDSSFESNLVNYIKLSNEFEEFDQVAIFFPFHIESFECKEKAIIDTKYSVTNYAITSGNLLSLKHIEQAGFFMDDLFIDWVDEEICLRFTKLNFKIVRVNSVFLKHLIGNGTKKINFFGKTKFFDDYAPIRYYYITRNLFVLCRLYPSEAKRLKRRWYKQFRRIVFYDNHNKLSKIHYLFKGLFHYFIGKSGSIVNNKTQKN